MEETMLTFNGIDGSTGGYLTPPMTAADLSKVATGETIESQHLLELRQRRERETHAHYGVVEGVDPKDLGQTGWAVVFAENTDPKVEEALKPLLELRQSQASAKVELYRECRGETGYRQNQTKRDFLKPYKAGTGLVDPKKFPYYVLLVGDPEAIPYRFQYQLDVQYAVGRIHFETAEEYHRYAQSVVAAETQPPAQPRLAAFFGVANADDPSTQASSERLVKPLAEFAGADQPQWKVETIDSGLATKAALAELLGGSRTPAFLFTASHGLGFPKGDYRQEEHAGALLCQDWPGTKWRGKFTQDFYYAGDDLASKARVHGLIAMFFACYGAGMPKTADFPDPATLERTLLAERAFVSRLPQRLLGHPQGGALAVVGHVERAWAYSFGGGQLQTFEDTLKKLMTGFPVGAALESFNSRYAELASDLTEVLERIKLDNLQPDHNLLASMWSSHNDARNYAVIGDPAVRIRCRDSKEDGERPVITLQSSTPFAPPVTQVPDEKAQPVTAPDELQYGILDTFREAQGRVSETLEQIGSRLAATIQRTIDGLTNLEVATYVSDDMSLVKYESGQFSGARLRAVTRIGLDGRTLVCVPETEGKVDETLWRIHAEAVDKALTHRTEMAKVVSSAVSGLIPGWKLK